MEKAFSKIPSLVRRPEMMVSVIIPNYNHGAFLKQRIESVLNQTYSSFEIIILDDASTDNSREIIEEYRQHPKVKTIVYNNVNSGSPFIQWKRGIELADGEYTWIAESDDWAHPGFLQKLTTTIGQNENVGICFTSSNWIDAMGHLGKDLSLYNDEFFRSGAEEIKNYLVRYNTIQNASAALLKTSLAKKHLGKIIKFRSCGDWLLYIDILRKSNLVYVSEKLNNFRWYHNNVSNTAAKKGRWVSEGIKVLACSQAFKIKFSKKDLLGIKNYWLQKTLEFAHLRRFKLRVYILFYISLFSLKNFKYFFLQRN